MHPQNRGRKMISWVYRMAAIAAVVLFAGAASAQQFTMKLSSPTVNDAIHEWMKTFKAGVEQRSGGRIKVEIYPASQLGQIPATVDGVLGQRFQLRLKELCLNSHQIL